MDRAELPAFAAHLPDPMPLVTVLMPVRNGERWLGDALESVLGQSLSDLELVVVDDGSSDETPEILARYAAHDSRMRVLRPEGEGLVAALNSGIAAATAPLIARLDADDVALPHRLERQIVQLDSHHDMGLLGSWAHRIDDSGRVTGRIEPAVESTALRKVLVNTNPFIHSSVMFRTAIARDLGGYRTAFEAAEDYDLWLRISEAAEVANIPEALIRYRVHATNVTRQKVIRQQFSVRLAKTARRFRRKSGKDPAAGLKNPPDWWAPEAETEFYAQDAQIYRFLHLADTTFAQRVALRAVDPSAVAARLGELTHGERKLGQLAVLNLLRRADRGPHLSTAALATLLIRLHPARAFRFAYATLTRARRSRSALTTDA